MRFPIPAESLDGIVKDIDVLFRAAIEGDVELDVQKLEGMLFLRGTIRGAYEFDCARCLSSRARSLELPIHWTLIPKSTFSDPDNDQEVELTSDDMDTSFYEGEEIDLGDLAREALLLELQPVPRCGESEDCKTTFPTPNEDEWPTKPKLDPRWGALQAMLEAKKKN
ncbi:MAG: uncharacterized metal-binding protein YceD (DUF177 family) [Bradymonadia bacterium]